MSLIAMIMPHNKRPDLSGKHWSSLQVCGEQLIWAWVAHRDDKGDLLGDTCLVLQQAGWYVLMTVAEEKEHKGKCVSCQASVCTKSANVLSAKANHRAEPRAKDWAEHSTPGGHCRATGEGRGEGRGEELSGHEYN